MLKKMSVLFLLVGLSFTTLVSAEEISYSREQCLEMAVTRNPMVLASVERKAQAEWNKKGAFGDFLPKLNMDYSYTYLDDENSINADFLGIGEVTTSVHDNFRMGLSVDQPLFTGFRILETYNLADLGLKGAIAGEQLATLEVTYQTVRAYYSYLMAQKIQKVADDAVVQLSSHLFDSEQFYKNEIIPLNDLLESKVHLANAQQDARVAASTTRMARMQLATVIKEPLARPFLVEDTPDFDGLTGSVEEFTAQALKVRPELQQANYRYAATKKEITLAKSMYYPTITLSAGHNRYGDDALVDGSGVSDIQEEDETMIGVYASWELIAWGQTGHRVNQAAAASREANQTLTSVMDEITLEVQDNYIYTNTAYANIATAKIAVEQAKESLRMSELRYKNQISTNTEVLDAQTLLTDTETKYYQAVYEYNIGLAGLCRAVGVKNRQELAVN